MYAQAVQHLDDGRVHHGWAAQVILAVFWRRVLRQVLVKQYLVDEAGETVPVVLWLWFRQTQMPIKVVVFLSKLVKLC